MLQHSRGRGFWMTLLESNVELFTCGVPATVLPRLEKLKQEFCLDYHEGIQAFYDAKV